MTSFLRSAVNDIGSKSYNNGQASRAWPVVEDSKRSQFPICHFSERHGLALGCGEQDRQSLELGAGCGPLHQTRKVRSADEDGIAATKPYRIRACHGQRRDAVQ